MSGEGEWAWIYSDKIPHYMPDVRYSFDRVLSSDRLRPAPVCGWGHTLAVFDGDAVVGWCDCWSPDCNYSALDLWRAAVRGIMAGALCR